MAEQKAPHRTPLERRLNATSTVPLGRRPLTERTRLGLRLRSSSGAARPALGRSARMEHLDVLVLLCGRDHRMGLLARTLASDWMVVISWVGPKVGSRLGATRVARSRRMGVNVRRRSGPRRPERPGDA